jgi:hypothetical protein
MARGGIGGMVNDVNLRVGALAEPVHPAEALRHAFER